MQIIRYILIILVYHTGLNRIGAQPTTYWLNMGVGLNSMHELNAKLHSPNVGYSIGFSSQKNLSQQNIFFSAGIQYEYKHFQPYTTSVFDLQLQKNIILTNSFTQHELTLPLLVVRSLPKIHFGGGLKLCYLFKASSTLIPNPKEWQTFKYYYKDRETTAPYTRFNIAPTFMIGVPLLNRLVIRYHIGYTIIADPQQFVFPEYRILQQNLCIKLKIR